MSLKWIQTRLMSHNITAYNADYISQYLMRSRNPGMSIEEPLRRYRDEQKAKQRRKGMKL